MNVVSDALDFIVYFLSWKVALRKHVIHWEFDRNKVEKIVVIDYGHEYFGRHNSTLKIDKNRGENHGKMWACLTVIFRNTIKMFSIWTAIVNSFWIHVIFILSSHLQLLTSNMWPQFLSPLATLLRHVTTILCYVYVYVFLMHVHLNVHLGIMYKIMCF
jgi:hypothetical protein